MSNTKPQGWPTNEGWMTQDEVDKSLAEMTANVKGFGDSIEEKVFQRVSARLSGVSIDGVEVINIERRRRIEAIATCLAQSSDGDIRYIEVALGLRPRQTGKQPWYLEWWTFAAVWSALGVWTYFAISPAMSALCLAFGAASCGILAVIKHSKRKTGTIK